MNRGVIHKSFREILPMTIGFGFALLVAELAFAFVLPRVLDQVADDLLQVPFLQNIFRAMLGTDVPMTLGPETFGTICWVHPVALAIVFAHAIVCFTRIPAGEVDRGTIDILLGMPVSRWQVFVSDTVVGVTGGVVILIMGYLGNVIGSRGAAIEMRPDLIRIAIVVVNLLCMYMVVAACASLFSALSDRRGRAIAAVFILLAASFLLNYLSQFWDPLKRLEFLSVLHYHRPLYVLRDGVLPWGDMTVLLISAGVLWAIAGIVFSRRDLCTV